VLALVLHALRARRAQSLTMFTLALLAGLGSAAAPWFVTWGGDAVARANLATAVTDHLVIASGSQPYEPGADSPIQFTRDQLAEHLAIPGLRTEVGANVSAALGQVESDASASVDPVQTHIAYHDDVCAHLDLVVGACPGRGEAMIARSAAELLGLGPGDVMVVNASRTSQDVTLRVSGVYLVRHPREIYWSGTDLLPELGEEGGEPAFVSEETLLDLPVSTVDVEAHMLLPDSAFTGPGDNLTGTLRRAAGELHQQHIDITTTATSLVRRIADDRRLVLLGVVVGAAQLVLVCWVGLFLAVRHTAEDRRGDVGLLKLRGSSKRRVWMLLALSSGVPVVAGIVIGAVVGFGAAAGLAHSVEGGAALLGVAHNSRLSTLDTLWLSLAATALAGLGLVGAVAAEWRTVRTPVADLLRRVPARQRGWRADAAELILVAVAGAGVYQARVEASRDSDASALALLAPALVAIAVALLVARALMPLAAGVGARALRAGRAGTALAALHLARRQGTHRVFAVLAVAAAVFTTTTIVWHAASSAWRQRAVLELGAGSVLTVDAPSATALLDAVRAVDPEGRYAMAVASTLGRRTEDRMVAVDATRLARVGLLPDGLPTAGAIAALLRPPAPEPPAVHDGQISLDVALVGTGDPRTAGVAPVPLGLRLHLSTVDGRPVAVDFPLTPGRSTVEATVSQCPERCRLVALQVTGPPNAGLPEAQTVEVYGLAQGGGAILGPALLGDVARWRTTLIHPAGPPEVSPRDDRLAITLAAHSFPGEAGIDGWVLPIVAPSPLPVVVAGPPPDMAGPEARIAVLGGAPVPYRVAASVPVLPQVAGQGMFVDLEYALRSNDAPTAALELSVWMTADAPHTLVPALAERGVTVLGESSVASRTANLAGLGPGLALLFGYFAAAVVLLLGAGVSFVGSTVERSGRVDELAALRGQGLSARTVRGAGIAGNAVLVAGATVTGVLAALLAQALVTAGLPVFSDGWAVLPVPAGLTPVTLSVAVGVVVAVIGVASLWGAGRLVSAVTRRTSTTRTGGRGAQ